MRVYRERFENLHQRQPGPPVTCDFVYCDTDASRGEDVARKHLAGYLTSVLEHYELESDHLKDLKGYESYGTAVDALKAIGLEQLCEMYLGVQAWGTPDQIIEKVRERRRIIGDYDLTCCFRYAGLPYDDVEKSMRTFAAEVLPVLSSDAAGMAGVGDGLRLTTAG